MIAGLQDMAEYVGFFSYLCGATLGAGAALYIARYSDRARDDRRAMIAACATIAVWCLVTIVSSPSGAGSELAGTARNLALIALIFRMFSADGRDESLKPTRPLIAALVLVELCQPVLLLIEARWGAVPVVSRLVFESSALLSMLVAIGALVLLHNLYAGAAAGSRRIIRRGAIGLAGLFVYELNLSMTAWLGGEYPVILLQLHGLFAGLMAAMLAFGANTATAGMQFRPSRAVTFQSLSLLLIGSYILVMVLATRSLALLGEDMARASQALFLVFALLAALIWLPSQRLRDRLRVLAAKHLFQHRYDYREEWLRFTRTIGHASNSDTSLSERAIKAIADIADSPAGILLLPDESAQLELTARWKWATLEVPAIAGNSRLCALLERHSHILDLDEVRAGIDRVGEQAHVPDWLIETDDAWALVPLVHFDRLVGAVILARPRIARQLDWEDFDLLKVAGQQLASYLAEQSSQRALMDASRFDEFNRRMAFVMHDIKNLASQISLLSANAQKHADNPEFRADMLVTLRNSSEKLSTLLSRLDRYGTAQVRELREVELAALADDLVARFRAIHPVELIQAEPVTVLAHAEALEQALVHLVQNAIDASEPGVPVHLNVTAGNMNGEIEVIDAGSGMSPEFLRNGLFKPFVSSKQGGFGIGAMEARETIRAMDGRIAVTSREGIGSRFSITIPRAPGVQSKADPTGRHHERAA